MYIQLRSARQEFFPPSFILVSFIFCLLIGSRCTRRSSARRRRLPTFQRVLSRPILWTGQLYDWFLMKPSRLLFSPFFGEIYIPLRIGVLTDACQFLLLQRRRGSCQGSYKHDQAKAQGESCKSSTVLSWLCRVAGLGWSMHSSWILATVLIDEFPHVSCFKGQMERTTAESACHG